MKSLKRYLPIFIIVLISLAAWGMGVHHYLSFDTLRVHHADLETYINIYPLTSFAVYMGVYIALVGLSIPGAAFMTLTGGFLFGQLVGTGLVVMSATIGATILFVSAKMASEDLVSQKAGPWVDKMKAVFQIPLRTFVIGTFIGIIPGSFVYVSIGNALKDVILTTDLTPKIILEPKVVVALIGLGILSLLPILYRRFSNR
jgi:uncharacterized membrane protein YdjX (TVP38/TMEM64 family)